MFNPFLVPIDLAIPIWQSLRFHGGDAVADLERRGASF